MKKPNPWAFLNGAWVVHRDGSRASSIEIIKPKSLAEFTSLLEESRRLLDINQTVVQAS